MEKQSVKVTKKANVKTNVKETVKDTMKENASEIAKVVKTTAKESTSAGRSYVENPRIVTAVGCKVVAVSMPRTIQRIAENLNMNPQEVFVRCKFEYHNGTYYVSQKLKILTKADYKKLLDAKNTGDPIDLDVDTDNGFFYVTRDVSVDDLFTESVKSNTATVKSLSDLI